MIHLMRRAAILPVGLFLLAFHGAPVVGDEPARRRPNVLFLLTDDQRADTIAALGNRAIVTPNLDRLTHSGLAFDNAYCMGGDIPAVCLPSRTMLLSGRSLFHIKALKPDSPDLPSAFRAAGYETYHHGKNGNTPKAIQRHFEHNHYLGNDQAERLSGFPGREIADAAVTFLEKGRDPKRPFLMYLAFGNPHDPRVVTPEYRARYDDAAIPLPRDFLPLHPFNNGELTIRDEALAPWPRTPEIVRRHLADYYGVITYLDMQIGRVLEALRASGQAENTLIVFSSDHGLALGSHGLFGKQNLYEAGMKVPLIFSGLGIKPGRTAALVTLFDLFPTLCDLADVSTPAGLDGKSFADVVRGKADRARETVFFAYRDVQRGVRDGDWKLLRYPRINRSQLFDLKTDPDELHDLAASPEAAERLAGLTDLLKREQAAYGDTLPLTSEHPGPAGAVDPSTLIPKVKP